jgi:Holliday junction DNA helicase RuvA
MFAKLTGTVDSLAEDHLVLDVNGVGYLVFASSRTLGGLAPGDSVSLAIETQVGEDHIRLYGFRSGAEQQWFRLLQTVQGVGARVALAILSTLDGEALATAIGTQDKTMLTRCAGVGPKLAQRIASELRDKVPALPVATPGSTARPVTGAGADAVSALLNLGYRPADAQAAVNEALAGAESEPPLPELIRLSLKQLARP